MGCHEMRGVHGAHDASVLLRVFRGTGGTGRRGRHVSDWRKACKIDCPNCTDAQLFIAIPCGSPVTVCALHVWTNRCVFVLTKLNRLNFNTSQDGTGLGNFMVVALVATLWDVQTQQSANRNMERFLTALNLSRVSVSQDKIKVMEIMKDTVKTANAQGGSRCQTGSQLCSTLYKGPALSLTSARQVKPPRVSSRTVVGDKLFTNKDVQFESLGDMKARSGCLTPTIAIVQVGTRQAFKGFIYIRGPKEDIGKSWEAMVVTCYIIIIMCFLLPY